MKRKKVFVFGSNLAGIHGAGSARAAHQHFGAKWGLGVGFHGSSYAIPTKDQKLRVLPFHIIQRYVRDFVEYAHRHPEMEFDIVKVGCGLAGIPEETMRALFVLCPKNCNLPDGWGSRRFNSTNLIIQLIAENGVCTIDELEKNLGCSRSTILKSLKGLMRRGTVSIADNLGPRYHTYVLAHPTH